MRRKEIWQSDGLRFKAVTHRGEDIIFVSHTNKEESIELELYKDIKPLIDVLEFILMVQLINIPLESSDSDDTFRIEVLSDDTYKIKRLDGKGCIQLHKIHLQELVSFLNNIEKGRYFF